MHSADTSRSDASVRSLLQRMGFDQRECEVYLALLAMKAGKVTAIAAAARQPRTLTYVVLQKLEAKGIVSRVRRGHALQFIAESPKHLLSYAEHRRDEAGALAELVKAALPKIDSMMPRLSGEPRVSLLHGLSGIRELYRDSLHQDFVGISNPASLYETFGADAVAKLYADIPFHGRDLFPDSPEARAHIKEVPPTETYQIRLLPAGMPYKSDMIVYRDTVALFAYDDQKTIVRIENATLADSFRAWFELLWAGAKA